MYDNCQEVEQAIEARVNYYGTECDGTYAWPVDDDVYTERDEDE
jgi:hypothetical protein